MARTPQKEKRKKRKGGKRAPREEEEEEEARRAEDGEMECDGDDEGEEEDGEEEDGEMEYDPRAYDCLHSVEMEWPCLSFDIVDDELGEARSAFPHTLVLVAGTQAGDAAENAIIVARLSRLGQGNHGDKYDSEEEAFGSDDESDDGGGAAGGGKGLRTRFIRHHGGINRTRCMPQDTGIVATWGESGYVQVWDATPQIAELAAEGLGAAGPAGGGGATQKRVTLAPRHVFTGHEDEGFALGWSPARAGRLASGDCRGRIHCWEAREGGRWAVEAAPRTGHAASVEDIAWSPTEETVFASSSVDRSVRVWDTRQAAAALEVTAHETDVNVIGWNALTSYMLASGADDGVFRIWDLRKFARGAQPVAHFKYHTTPVSSIEWCPFEASSLCVSTAASVTVWDLAVERDVDEEMAIGEGVRHAPGHDELPPQLMFQHMGQTDIKEAHWHRCAGSHAPPRSFTAAAPRD